MRERHSNTPARYQVGAIVSAKAEPEWVHARCHGMPSTAIARIEYDRKRERLTIFFVSGGIYEYVDVPPEVAASFQSAFSKSAFFTSYIRDRYDFRELAPAR